MVKKVKVFHVVIFALLFILSAAFFSFSKQGLSQSTTSAKLNGVSWSDNIGWISWSSTLCDRNSNGLYEGGTDGATGCPTSGPAGQYQVLVDENGYLSGYGWSEHIGWVSFNASEIWMNNIPIYLGCPRGNPCQPARLVKDGGTDKIIGWARALSADNKGWDGFISLGTQTGDSQTYGPTKGPSGALSGYVWGSDVVGWTSMSHNQGNGAVLVDNVGVCDQTSAGQSFSVPPTNLCSNGTATSVVTNPSTYNWSCDIGASTVPCSANRIINGACSSPVVENSCAEGSLVYDTSDTGQITSIWSCNGINGGTPALCQRTCPSGQIVINDLCTPPPPPDDCELVIDNVVQPKKVVSTETGKCDIGWRATVTGGGACNAASIECRINGTVVQPPYTNESLDIGTHTITCTTTINGTTLSSTITQKPQCRLNPKGGEF